MKFSKWRIFHVIFLVIILTLLLYAPFISSTLNTLDDEKLVQTLTNSGHNSLQRFYPRSAPYYFRPLTFSTYDLDYKLHLCFPHLMHLENVLIHTINSVLVACVAYCLGGLQTAFWTSIIFSVHPINTEPVNWISARPDLLAGMFCLLAMLAISRLKRWFYIFIAVFCYFLGLLSKEVTIGFLPLMLIFSPVIVNFAGNKTLDGKQLAKLRIALLIVFIFVTVLYFMLRYPELRFWYHYKTVPHKIKLLPKGKAYSETENLAYHVTTALGALGFYFKKFFIPWPLNFAIASINKKIYVPVGILALIGACFLFLRERKILSFGLVWFLCFIAPAILVAIRRFAWTPFAERYLYVPSFGLALFVGAILNVVQEKVLFEWSKKVITAVFMVYGLILCGSTLHRNYLWQDNYLLYKDAVEKSPNFGPVHNQLAIALARKGRKEEAEKHFIIAAKLTKGKVSYVLADINALQYKQKELPTDKVLGLYDQLIEKAENKRVRAIALRRAIYYIRSLFFDQKVTEANKKVLQEKMISYYELLSNYDEKAFCKYKIGQLWLNLGDRKKAQHYFNAACKLAHKDAYFKNAACKLAGKLNQMESK